MSNRGPMRRGPVQKPNNPGQTMGRLLSYLFRYYAFPFVIVIVCILISALASVQGTLFVRTLLDQYVAPFIGTGSLDSASLLQALIQLALIFATGVLCSYLYNRIMVNISQGVLKHVRDDMFEKMEALPIRYFDTHTHGELMSRYTNDTDTLRQMLGQTIPQFLNSGVTIVSVGASMIILSWQLSIITGILFLIMIRCSGFVGGKSGKYFSQQQKQLGKVNGYIEEMIEGQKVVKVFCREDISKEEFKVMNEELCEAATKANSFANILGPISTNLGHATYGITAMVGCIFALTGIGTLTIGSIASFLQFTRQFSMPINQITQQFSNVISALAGAERIFNVMDQKPETDEGLVTLVNAIKEEDGTIQETEDRTGLWAWKHPHPDGTVTYNELKGDVRFYNVDFGYNENKIVLHDVSLFAKPGQKLAFVGATGAGKTTITNLINRFYDIQDGSITYDGIDIKLIKKADLRHSLGIVLQDTHLFTGSVADNIRYGKLDATEEEVVAAAKLANADYFIKHLPQGYDTVLTQDGGSLSQGQRQLLAIARAAIANPPVLILDEATSSIDTRTEAIVQRGMDKLMEGRTVFVIAHRLSTVQNSNAIMVLDQGQIIERGDHDELIEQKGRYYQLYTGAFELD